MKFQKIALVFFMLTVAGEAQSSWLGRFGFSNLDGEGRGFRNNHARVRAFMTGPKDHVPAYVDWTQVMGEEFSTQTRVVLQDPTNISEVLGAYSRVSIAREVGDFVDSYGFYQREVDPGARTRVFDNGDSYATTLLCERDHTHFLAEHGLVGQQPHIPALLQTTSFAFTEKMLLNLLERPCFSVGLVGVPLTQAGAQDIRFCLQQKRLRGEFEDTPARVVIRGKRGAGGIETAQTFDTLLEAFGGTRVRSLVLEGAGFQGKELGLLEPWLGENSVTSLALGTDKFHEKSLLKLVPSFGKLTHLRLKATSPMDPKFFTTFGAMLTDTSAHGRVMSFSRNGCTFEMKPRSHVLAAMSLIPRISLVSRLLTRGRMG